jgi:hypothetical protein
MGETDSKEPDVSVTTETNIIKRSMAAFAVIGVLLLAACGSSSSSNAITNVDASTFLTTVSQPGVTVVDVRTPEEFAAGLARAEAAAQRRMRAATLRRESGYGFA